MAWQNGVNRVTGVIGVNGVNVMNMMIGKNGIHLVVEVNWLNEEIGEWG